VNEFGHSLQKENKMITVTVTTEDRTLMTACVDNDKQACQIGLHFLIDMFTAYVAALAKQDEQAPSDVYDDIADMNALLPIVADMSDNEHVENQNWYSTFEDMYTITIK
jgi:hypothetical protein